MGPDFVYSASTGVVSVSDGLYTHGTILLDELSSKIKASRARGSQKQQTCTAERRYPSQTDKQPKATRNPVLITPFYSKPPYPPPFNHSINLNPNPSQNPTLTHTTTLSQPSPPPRLAPPPPQGKQLKKKK